MIATSVKRLGALVRERRRELEWSQADLAAKAMVSRQWVSGFENGKESVELGAVLRVIRVLGLSVDVIPRRTSAIDLDVIVDG